MSHVRLQINDVVEFDDEISEWVARPPEFVKEAIRPGAAPEPWLKAVMLALTDAVVMKQSADIRVHHDEKGWLVGVRNTWLAEVRDA